MLLAAASVANTALKASLYAFKEIEPSLKASSSSLILPIEAAQAVFPFSKLVVKSSQAYATPLTYSSIEPKEDKSSIPVAAIIAERSLPGPSISPRSSLL